MRIAERSGVAYEGVKTILKGVNDSAVMSPHLKIATAALLSVLNAIDVCDLLVQTICRPVSYDQ